MSRGESPNRYVGLRCPMCGDQSPTVDQHTDPRRDAMRKWWSDHKEKHQPYPVIERRGAPAETAEYWSGVHIDSLRAAARLLTTSGDPHDILPEVEAEIATRTAGEKGES